MEKFFSRLNKDSSSRNSSGVFASTNGASNSRSADVLSLNAGSTSSLVEYVADPGLRKSILLFNVNERENIRRAYLQKGPCQPKKHKFPWTKIGNHNRRFVKKWFDEYSEWLEYSITKDAALCLCCYLFKDEIGSGEAGGDRSDAFINEGFRNWKKKERIDVHVGTISSLHNKCLTACHNLMKQKRHIEVVVSKHSEQSRIDYRVRLTATVDCIRFLLRQGLAFRGRDESVESSNRGNFIELLNFLGDHNEEINKVILKNAPENLKLTSPMIQRDIINSIAVEVTNTVVSEIGDEVFSLLVDEARDVSVKEQLAIVLRFVDEKGFIIERFLGLVHVKNTSALSLKEAIDDMFSKHGLSVSSIRGQGYDGASNMNGEFNGLKSLIMKENESAFYVHCFAHQLQLTLVAVARNHTKIGAFFEMVSILINVVGASCKRRDLFREKQFQNTIQLISDGELLTGRGMNQEKTLKRAGDTRWGSHHGTVMSLLSMFSSVTDVLLIIGEDGENQKHRIQADTLLENMQCFEFVFILHLMNSVLGITSDLSQALQRNDQDIVNAMTLVRTTKQQLQTMRDDGWESLLEEVSLFCIKENIIVPNMEDEFVVQGKSRRRRNPNENKNIHYYRVDLFYAVIDSQLLELNSRFNEVNTELLVCMSCLNPRDSFLAFDKAKLLRVAKFYPSEFSTLDLMALNYQLDNYILDLRSNEEFSDVVRVSDLARKLVQLKKHRVYPLVYMLIKLALTLPVATATVERVFSAMKIIKSQLRNRLGDELMNDSLVGYIEKDILQDIKNEDIIKRFQNMKFRRGML